MEIEISVLAEHLDDLNKKLAPTASNMPVILALHAASSALLQSGETTDQQANSLDASIEALHSLSSVLAEKEAELKRLSDVEVQLKNYQQAVIDADRLLGEAIEEFNVKDALIKLLKERVEVLGKAAKAPPLVSKPMWQIQAGFHSKFGESVNPYQFDWFKAGFRAAETAHKIQNINN